MRLRGGDLGARIEELTALLRDDGELTVRSTSAGASPALIDLRISAPGGDAGHDMSFRYSETYEASHGEWALVEYVYLMAWQTGLGQREYHWHPLGGAGEAVLHAHCVGAGSSDRGHYRSYRVLLEEARDEFLRMYAAGEPVDCRDLHPFSESRV